VNSEVQMRLVVARCDHSVHRVKHHYLLCVLDHFEEIDRNIRLTWAVGIIIISGIVHTLTA
jgi:hypothetical protein